MSVSLTLSGTPPFAVTYSVQREDELPEELSKAFMATRGKIEIQPSRGGRYTFAFIRVSDAYYDNVRLLGPQIEQSITEPATAVFTSGKFAAELKKRILNSCDTVIGVNVDLTVSAAYPENTLDT
jgi:nucleoporin POM152